jgi:hypothetical protein
MQPSSGETPNLNLPPPVGDQQPLPPVAEGQGQPSQPETTPGPAAGPERAPSTAASASPLLAAPAPIPPAPVQSTQNDVASTSKPASTKLIKDNDLIDKEWVDKAKRIVEQTRSDPHEQSEKLTMVKADYMSKQYHKTIKVNK